MDSHSPYRNRAGFFALIAFFAFFVLSAKAAWCQRAFEGGFYGGYSGSNLNLKALPPQNAYRNFTLANQAHGFVMGGDFSYVRRLRRAAVGLRIGSQWSDTAVATNSSCCENSLNVFPLTASGYLQWHRLYGGGGPGWYWVSFDEQDSGNNGLCIANCSNTNPIISQHASHAGYQFFGGYNFFARGGASVFVEGKYSKANVPFKNGSIFFDAAQAGTPLNVGSFDVVLGFRFGGLHEN
jgi:hypothetical protein